MIQRLINSMQTIGRLLSGIVRRSEAIDPMQAVQNDPVRGISNRTISSYSSINP